MNTKPSKGYFERLSRESSECRKRVSQYDDAQRERLDTIARSLMGQPVTSNVGGTGR